MSVIDTPVRSDDAISKQRFSTASKSSKERKIDLGESLNPDSRLNSHYYYSAGSFKFIVDKSFKPETLDEIKITNVPFLPNWYEGILSIHGNIMPVIDIIKFAQHEQMNVTKSVNENKYLLKLEHSRYSPIVFSLDSLPQLVNTTSLEVKVRSDSDSEWVESYLIDGNKEIAVIDSDMLFQSLMTKQ